MSDTAKRVRAGLTGPIASLRTPFNRDGSIDYDGVRRVIDFNLDAGSPVTLLTAGDSHLVCMSDAEIWEMNRVAVEHTAGRALTVASDWEFATPQAVEFAQYAAALGADIVMARPPDWANSATPDLLYRHYAAIGERLPVMLVTNVFSQRPAFGLAMLGDMVQRVPQLLAVKDDLAGDFARQLALALHRDCAVISGGGLRNFVNMRPYGCDGFMDRHMNFAPAVSHRFWAAMQRDDMAAARTVISDIELPLETFMAAFPGGRDAAVHGLLEIFEIAGRWRRPPYHSLTDAEVARLRDYVAELGLL